MELVMRITILLILAICSIITSASAQATGGIVELLFLVVFVALLALYLFFIGFEEYDAVMKRKPPVRRLRLKEYLSPTYRRVHIRDFHLKSRVASST